MSDRAATVVYVVYSGEFIVDLPLSAHLHDRYVFGAFGVVSMSGERVVKSGVLLVAVFDDSLYVRRVKSSLFLARKMVKVLSA